MEINRRHYFRSGPRIMTGISTGGLNYYRTVWNKNKNNNNKATTTKRKQNNHQKQQNNKTTKQQKQNNKTTKNNNSMDHLPTGQTTSCSKQ